MLRLCLEMEGEPLHSPSPKLFPDLWEGLNASTL